MKKEENHKKKQFIEKQEPENTIKLSSLRKTICKI